MNRLIIVGNGFDLAHGLPTRYSDFLEWYWSKLNFLKKTPYGMYLYGDKILELQLFAPISNCKSYQDLKKELDYYEDRLEPNQNYTFKNGFFLEISDNPMTHWVDIEMFYKQKLEEAFNSNNRITKINKLNKEFLDVRELFEEYLNEKILPLEDNQKCIPIMQEILEGWVEGKSYTTQFINNIPNHLLNIESFKTTLNYNPSRFHVNDGRTCILNFNYTNTIFRYFPKLTETRFNYIHGNYQNKNHPIIFGYGDESDELFPLLEKANKNEFLQFTKSASYLKQINYTTLMNFIDSDNFIVEIMGHSLAISDRTLLKTIFENENCQYIFMYYHERVDGTNDFFDKSANISRHFTDKKMMRKKVAPEVFCCPLPQMQ